MKSKLACVLIDSDSVVNDRMSENSTVIRRSMQSASLMWTTLSLRSRRRSSCGT